MQITQVLFTIFLTSLIIFAERLFPFVIFSKKTPGKLIHFFEKYIPFFVMAGLLIYCLRSVNFSKLSSWVPPISGVFFTFFTYLWKKNSMISIFGATILYMVLIRIL